MNAVAEKPKEKVKVPPRYVMPKPKTGSYVNWFHNNDPRNPHRVMVIECYEEKIRVQDPMGGAWVYKTCANRNDPAVINKEYDFSHPSEGTWDFIEEEVADAQWRKQIESDLIAMSKRLEVLEGMRSPKKD